jgi:DNA polymerase-3 subunit gamma/tau
MREEQQLSLARKHRPDSMETYAGNDRVKEKFLKRRTVSKPQVILLHGESGCGKTTFARIIAEDYRCDHSDALTGACGVCDSCLEIKEYIRTGATDSIDYIKEIDIASNRGVDAVNNFLSDINIPAFGGGYKIYILDECHKASDSAQNALLKVTEEPPENVVFIFCTTNPEEMLPTLKNRCTLKLQVKKPDVKSLAGVLQRICYLENIKYDAKGLYLIANRSDLVFREAVNTLEQISAEQGDATYTSVLTALDELANSDLFSFFRALINNDIMSYVNLLCSIKQKIDLTTFVQRLLEFVKRGIKILNNVPLDGMTEGELKSYKDLFMQFSVVEISTLIQRLLDMTTGDTEVKLLLLGYTGLNQSLGSTTSNSSALEDILKPPADEATLEASASTENAEIRRNPTEEQRKATLDALTQDGSMADLTACFGGSLISKE